MKIINERLNEKFERNSENKLSTLNIGKIVLIQDWLKKYNIKHYKINDNFSIDITGNLYLQYKEIDVLPDYIQFNNVFGFMECNLKTFRGVPYFVDKHFLTMNKEVIITEYLPRILKGDLFINSFKIPDDELFKYRKIFKGKMYIGVEPKTRKWILRK